MTAELAEARFLARLTALGCPVPSELLREALTHTSAAGERRPSNQRLEFLGDAVLDLVVAEVLFRERPDWPEGELTRRRALLVREAALASAGRRLGLHEVLAVADGAREEGVHERASVLADAFEALVGAAYLSGGLTAAGALVETGLGPISEWVAERETSRDPRTRLQEWAQEQGRPLPEFRVTDEDGPPHRRQFTVEVLVEGRVMGEGRGSSKRRAAASAAAQALRRLEERPER